MRAAQHRVSRDAGQAPVHYFGFIGTTTGYPSAETWTERDARWSSQGVQCERLVDGAEQRPAPGDELVGELVRPGLWRVSTWGFGVVRRDVEGLSLTPKQLQGLAPLPVNTERMLRPAPLWCSIKIGNTAFRQIKIDAGQTIYVYGDEVSVSWWAPGPNAALGTFVDLGYSQQPIELPSDEETTSAEGLLYVDIARVETARQQGQDFATLSETYFAPNGARLTVPVPNGARRVQISRNTAGAVEAGDWIEGFDDGVGFTQLGAIPIVNRTSGAPVLVANVSHLQSPVEFLAEDVLWTLYWEIAP